ncbi:MAG: 16S rRNA (cytosine(1402)-N(4))-methyltransferase [Elusimicrobia bacterium GWA2_61_42]|nr:MAG: 16S rRNA (cytosine(1402)-N(4))-methyltransferase [Elusimicrobia bacterium GWA2_61_42]OGR76437.1 MAG: 16S rRNA (cytosine(1402)-N(4))-methyltransferase [Elusimicrobia bacterium GWC2_61_25]
MTEEAPKPHKRRVRYLGKNPRRFDQKYKELDPAKYAGDVAHIIAKGLTPAGTHRPICVKEILEVLRPAPGAVCLDATLGYGGHAKELLARILPGGKLFAVDVDPLELPKTEARLRALGYGEKVLIVRKMNFAGIAALAPEAGGGFDCVLADLGVSSMQLDNPERGFTYKAEGPLDLRLNPERGRPAAELLRSVSAAALEKILFEYADEPYARIIALAVKDSPLPIRTTAELAAAVRSGLKKADGKLEEDVVKKSLQRTFMALRIAVNEELSVLDRFLEILPWCLRPGGRAAILSFHSGEDRRVKKAFLRGEAAGVYSSVAASPIRPSSEERHSNPRSACAKLRWAIRSDQQN